MRPATVVLFLLLTQACFGFGMSYETAFGKLYGVVLHLERYIAPAHLQDLATGDNLVLYAIKQDDEAVSDVIKRCDSGKLRKRAYELQEIITLIRRFGESHCADERDLKRIKDDVYEAKTNLEDLTK